MADNSTKTVMVNTSTTTAMPVLPPPITQKLFVETHPAVTEKDKSVHSEHGIIHYPFWYGGAASVVSGICTTPLGVGKLIPIH